jgi:phosphatidylserine/phosphatidylglycerophosphate/cardiolipin synthase-like enzyme/Ca2+-binding EF-hand superfamily protein
MPVPADGFVALGVVTSTVDANGLPAKPSVDVVRCVHKSIVSLGHTSNDRAKGMLWSDRRTGCKGKLSCWLVESPTSQDAKSFNPALSAGTFYAHASYNLPTEAIYCLSKRFCAFEQGGGKAIPVAVKFELTSRDSMMALMARTYFDMDELLLLYALFEEASGRTGKVTADSFRALFGTLDASDTLLGTVFRALDIDQSGYITFEEFAVALSTMCRGRLDDRVAFAYRICDIDNDGMVGREEVLTISSALAVILKQLDERERAGTSSTLGGNSLASSSSSSSAQVSIDVNSASYEFQANDVVANIFRKRTNVPVVDLSSSSSSSSSSSNDGDNEDDELVQGGGQYDAALNIDIEAIERAEHELEAELARSSSSASSSSATPVATLTEASSEMALTEVEFCQRAKIDPEFAQCFGLYYFFYRQVLAPIERKRYGEVLQVRDLEGWLEKEKGESWASWALQKFSAYDKRWFVVRDGFLAYYKREEDARASASSSASGTAAPPINVVSLSDATVYVGLQDDGEFYVSATAFSRKIFAPSKLERMRWSRAIRNNIERGFRFNSFAPVRSDAHARWFVNGASYYECLARLLARARRRVFIADWYFSPGLLLVRGQLPPDKRYRLDNLLRATAARGVQIYLLVWNAPTIGFDLQVKYVVQYMQSLHANIHALAHTSPGPVPLWSHHQKFVVVDDAAAFVGGVDLCYNRYDDERYLLLDPESRWFPGRDYSNLHFAGESNGPSAEDVIDRRQLPRMPWHDIHMLVSGASVPGDVARNFVQRWNHALKANSGGGGAGQLDLLLMPCPPAQAAVDEAHLFSATDGSGADKWRGTAGITAQVVRSACSWSAGIEEPERSIANAYRSLILNAKHYVIIHNQYFVSATSQPVPSNKLADALLQRLRRAINDRETFRVVIVLPVFPAGDLNVATTRYIIKYGYKTINRSSDRASSILERLTAEFPQVDLSQYIQFMAMRNYDYIDGACVTEQVYIHAKLALFDDRHAIIGSANINDRSLRGTRDSEICVVTTDEDLVDGVMNGVPTRAGKFARSLRMSLWRHLLGSAEHPISDEQILDPICSATYNDLLRATAARNTEIYNKVFLSLPDQARTVADVLGKRQNNHDLVDPDAVPLLKDIRGFLINFPMDFLIDEQCSPTVFDQEYLLPKIAFL